MGELWWYLSRSSGLVATVLIVASLAFGLFFSARSTGDRRTAAWWLDLHNYLGGLAFVFTVIHIFTVYQDELAGIGFTEILIPLTAEGWRWGITTGVIATYIFTLVVFTTWPQKRGSRRTWVAVHLLSIPGALLAATHAWMVGSSRDALWFQGLLAIFAGLVVYPAVLRLFTAVAKRRTRRPAPSVRARPQAPVRAVARR